MHPLLRSVSACYTQVTQNKTRLSSSHCQWSSSASTDCVCLLINWCTYSCQRLRPLKIKSRESNIRELASQSLAPSCYLTGSLSWSTPHYSTSQQFLFWGSLFLSLAIRSRCELGLLLPQCSLHQKTLFQMDICTKICFHSYKTRLANWYLRTPTQASGSAGVTTCWKTKKW